MRGRILYALFNGKGLRARVTGKVYGQGLRADIAFRNAHPLFTGKNDPKMSDI